MTLVAYSSTVEALDAHRTFERAGFEKTLRTRLELYKDYKLDGQL
jgi:hypothetical protein